MRDEMLRAKVLIFMIPLVLPIGQPRVEATERGADAVDQSASDVVEPATAAVSDGVER